MGEGQCESIKEGVVKLSVSGSGEASDLTEAKTCGGELLAGSQAGSSVSSR